MDNQDTNQNNSENMNLLGDYLKQKRVDKNFTLEKLSQKTKISVNILKSLESNDFKNLPSAAYIKGFVVNYVKVLGIPKDEAINKMEYTYLNVVGKPFPALNHTKTLPANQEKKQREAQSSESPQKVITSGESLIKGTKSIIPIAIFAVVVLIFVGGYKIVSTVVENEISKKKEKDLGPKIESSSALINEPQKVEPKEVKTEEPKVVEATPEEKKSEVKEEPKTEPVVKAEPEFPRNFPTVEFRKVRGKLFTVKSDAPENNDEKLLPQSIKDSMNSELQNIYIRAVDGNTWLSYKIDNNPIESVIINQGKDLFLQGSEIRVFLGNVNVTKIFYNNYLIDTPTRTGVKSLIFPEESNAKFQLPLFPKAKDDILYTSEEYTKRMNLEEEEIKKREESR